MKTQPRILLISLSVLIAALACTLGAAPTVTVPPPPPTETAPTLTVLPPSDTPVPPTEAPTATPGPAGTCELHVASDTTVYNRPSLSADAFGTLTSEETLQPTAVTADGWFGFDPGVAQAANVGPFRLRWVQNGPDLTTTGDCAGLPIIVGPPPGVCFEMFMETTDIHPSPDATSAMIATAQSQDYAAAIGQTTGWYLLDLSLGSLGIAQQGWMPEAAGNFNGPCDSLPVATP